MILRYFGHALFTLTLENGYTILTDPYGAYENYPRRMLKADVVSVSHHHFDHDALDMVEGSPALLDKAGVYNPAPALKVTAIPSWHDAVQGAKRGQNLIFVFEAEDLRIVHLGDLGHLPTDGQRRAIGTPDVLLIPVGGTYTLDAQAAAQTVALLRPRITIPMHYRTPYSNGNTLETEAPFLAQMGAAPFAMPLCRITRGDITERSPVLLMQVTQ